jgi:mannobiose 2-epimerase
MKTSTEILHDELAQELKNILNYWTKYAVDDVYGGFVGARNYQNKCVENAPKGIILNARILWSFAAAGNFYHDARYIFYCERAFYYLFNQFKDSKHGGVYWELDAQGNPVNKRKQTYAQAFAVYALSEYYLYSKNERAKQWAVELFNLIETQTKDTQYEGYLEAFAEDWSAIDDVRLSEKDQNDPKSMNTHLHLLEAYTTLYKIYPTHEIRTSIEDLLEIFYSKILNKTRLSFDLFFGMNWQPASRITSYGHDIEAIWLLIEAAKAIHNDSWISTTNKCATMIATQVLNEGYLKGFGLLNERNHLTETVDDDRHWWPQAEAMVGFYFAYQISGETRFLKAVLDLWEQVKKDIIDPQNGEWFFRVKSDGKPVLEEDKIGFWKCPYHNSRMCMVIMTMINEKVFVLGNNKISKTKLNIS